MTISIPVAGPASPVSIASLVERYGELPPDYVEFLAAHDGAQPPPNVLEGTHNAVGVRRFIPAAEILHKAANVEGLSPHLIPIAEDDSGNLVCIGVDDHKLYFWDHEVDHDRIISDDFAGFMKGLRPFDLSQIELQPGQVMSVWVNPDFKPEF